MPFTAEEMRRRFPNPGDLEAYLNAEDAAHQPKTEPWLHALVADHGKKYHGNTGPAYGLGIAVFLPGVSCERLLGRAGIEAAEESNS